MWLIAQKIALLALVVLVPALAACAARGLDAGVTAEELVVARDPLSRP